jgi:hypothetical protein
MIFQVDLVNLEAKSWVELADEQIVKAFVPKKTTWKKRSRWDGGQQ